MKVKTFLMCLTVSVFSLVPLFADLDVVGVQWEMKTEYAVDTEAFWADVQALLKTQERKPPEHGERLIVFPEYTSVFLSLGEYMDHILGAYDLESSWRSVSREYGYTRIADVFRAETLDTYEYLEKWKEIALTYESYLIPGTFFAYDPRQDKVVNRAVLISPEGEVIYYQDKVYLTPFEKEVLGLEASRQFWAEPVTIAGEVIALTICRDTFFESWEDEFGQVDLWIDIKANGQQFTQQTRKLFDEAVPERIEDIGGAAGMTVCLTGEFLELFWEGESSVVDERGKLLASVPEHTGTHLLRYTLGGE
jgi:predicted amidohydrolase